mmetsp:Transcript_1242/g.2805  ORF Transcript_1242/g.2805 Transcript_1242/m.2805 type:complete len:202 (-) Transcript_1242:722-1327(-)
MVRRRRPRGNPSVQALLGPGPRRQAHDARLRPDARRTRGDRAMLPGRFVALRRRRRRHVPASLGLRRLSRVGGVRARQVHVLHGEQRQVPQHGGVVPARDARAPHAQDPRGLPGVGPHRDVVALGLLREPGNVCGLRRHQDPGRRQHGDARADAPPPRLGPADGQAHLDANDNAAAADRRQLRVPLDRRSHFRRMVPGRIV